MMKAYVAKRPTASEAASEAMAKQETLPISEVCSSHRLDHILSQPSELKVSYSVPRSDSVNYVSDKTTGMLLPPEAQHVGKTAGLGLKRKNQEMKREIKAKKAKTLAEKRELLQEEIMRYGVAAIEKMYPRQYHYQQPQQQPQQQQQLQQQQQPKRPRISPKSSPIKMKPRPIGLDFEEVDARKILRPLSHDKYIKEPDYDCVVFINRRRGLVPLSSLCKADAKTVLSSNVKLLQGRNVRLGKPHFFVKHKGRLLAVGGSRDKSKQGIQVVKTPQLVKLEPSEQLMPFLVDDEFARFAVNAVVQVPAHFTNRVDIRQLKRQQRQKLLETGDLKTVLAEENRTIIHHLMEKLGSGGEDEEEIKGENKNTQEVEVKQAVVAQPEQKEDGEDDDMEGGEEEGENVVHQNLGMPANVKLHNQWSDPRTRGHIPIDITDDKPIHISDDFKKRIVDQKQSGCLSGYDTCDVEECYCKTDYEWRTVPVTETATPMTASGTATPKESNNPANSSGKDKSAKRNLKKVRRALKTLGVNFLHFEEEEEDGKIKQEVNDCGKDHCRFGCICDSIAGRSMAPTHCGKVECMFKCNCGGDALKIATSDKGHGRIGISAEGLRSSASLRRMAQEELKFSNAVVATGSGCDLLMLGTTAGRQRRERKVPSRYQDTGAFFDVAVATNSKNPMDDEFGDVAPVNTIAQTSAARRMAQESLKTDTIKKCAVLMPRLEIPQDVKPWCLFHATYDCPCFKYKSPLDFGPDVNASRNVSKRSLGNHFTTVKRSVPTTTKTCDSNNKKKDDEGEVKMPVKQKEKAPAAAAAAVSPSAPKAMKHNPLEHSARTFGHSIRKATVVTKYPHKLIISKKKDGYSIKPGPTAQEETHKKLKNTVMMGESPADRDLFVEGEDLDLSMKSKGTTKYVPWRLVQKKMCYKHITIWCFYRSGRPVLFVTPYDSKPYVRNAFNIKQFHADNKHAVPILVEALLRPIKEPPTEEDKSKYAILLNNGLAWEINGVLQKKQAGDTTEDVKQTASKPEGFTIVQPPVRRKTSAPLTPSPGGSSSSSSQTAVDTKVIPTCSIQHDVSVQKLPAGQNIVTMARPDMPTMQIRLPATTLQQHWCTVKVDGREGSVQCPDSTLALKVAVLRRASGLAMEEKTTVRIPIQVPGEVESFGVYAVPGLQSHVFVGPFNSKGNQYDANDVICLDEDSTNDVHAKTVSMEEGVLLSNNQEGEMTKKERSQVRQEAVLGQVPQMVVSPENKDSQVVDVVDLAKDDPDAGANPKYRPPYLNLKPSQHGRVVYSEKLAQVLRQSIDMPDGNNFMWISVDIFGRVRVLKKQDTVTFLHPKYDKHVVLCSTLNGVKRWLEEFVQSEKDLGQHTRVQAKEKQPVLSVKPMSALVQPSPLNQQSDQPKQAEITREINGRSFSAHRVANGQRTGLAIVFDRRQHKDMRSLFHQLNQLLACNGMRRIFSVVQILQRAKDEILQLQLEDDELTSSRKELMLKRSELFKVFSSGLTGLKVADKKAAVLALKDGLKKIKDVKSQSRPQNELPTRSSSQPTTPVQTRPMPAQLHQDMSNAQMDHQSTAEHQLLLAMPPCSQGPPGATPYSDVTGLQTVKKDGKVLRPMNAFMLWAKGYRRELISQGLDGATVSKLLADKWKSLGDDEKQKYYTEAEHLKNLHHLQHPNYKYSPKARRSVPPIKKAVSPKTPSDKAAAAAGNFLNGVVPMADINSLPEQQQSIPQFQLQLPGDVMSMTQVEDQKPLLTLSEITAEHANNFTAPPIVELD